MGKIFRIYFSQNAYMKQVVLARNVSLILRGRFPEKNVLQNLNSNINFVTVALILCVKVAQFCRFEKLSSFRTSVLAEQAACKYWLWPLV